MRADAVLAMIEPIETEVLEVLGLNVTQKGVRGPCPVHDGDNSTGFTYSLKDRKWTCWTNHCEKQYGWDIIGLVRGIRKLGYHEAVEWLVKEFKLKNSAEILDKYLLRKYIKKQLAVKHRAQPKEHFFDLRPYLAAGGSREYFHKRGFNNDTLNDFGCFVCQGMPKALYARAVISVHDLKGRVVGMAARQIDNTIDYCKWLYFPESFKPSEYIGGLYESCKKYKKDTITLCEGYFDAMAIYQAGAPAGAILGTHLYLGQVKQLIESGIKNVNLLLDPDDAGEKAAPVIIDRLSKYFKVSNYTGKLPNDPGDLPPGQLQAFLTEFSIL